MSTEFYADYIKKTTFDPETNSVRSKLVEERGAPNSECCDAPLKRYNNGTGLCSDCGEHAGPVKDEQKEAATDMKKKPASKTPKVEVPATEIPVKEEEEELEEGTFKVDVEGLPTMYIDGSVGEIKASLRKKLKDPKAIVSVERITPAEKKKELRAKVAEDQAAVDDFLKKGGKIKKLPPAHARSSSDMENDVKGRVDTSRLKTRGKVKSMGEEEQVDEISSELAGRAHSSARKQVDYKKTTPTTAKKSDQGTKALAYHQRKAVNPSHTGTSYKGSPGGVDVAAAYKSSSEPARKTSGKYIDKLKKQGIDVSEQDRVDEISNRAKGAYVRVAARDLHHQGSKAAQGVANNDREAIKKADRNINNRLQGIDRATRGMQKEGAMKRIATQNAEKERLGPKVKGTGLETFKKKPTNTFKKKPTNEEKDTHVTKDGHTAKKGLWYNIHKKRARGEAPAKPGDPDRPSAADLKRSQ